MPETRLNDFPVFFFDPSEKSQPEGKLIMPETRFSEFPVFSVDTRVGISWSASETNV